MGETIAQTLSATDIVFAYHQRTKHRLDGYAAGPETLDWTMQPNPFREFEGSHRVILPLGAEKLGTALDRVYAPGDIVPQSLSIRAVAALLELSMGLSAWKEYGPDRWALRCNPSSGNLHPTEAYLISHGIHGLEDGVYHYVSRDHALERRCKTTSDANPLQGRQTGLWIGLSSIHWREAWKYGERAFRYCQLDIGHALGALRYAAGALGWQVKLVKASSHQQIANLLGTNRDQDFLRGEREDPDVLLAVIPNSTPNNGMCKNAAAPILNPAQSQWSGQANILDSYPMYRWPIIGEVATATQEPYGESEPGPEVDYPPLGPTEAGAAAGIILKRRSAQHFDRHHTMGSIDFYRMLDSMLARPMTPWDVMDQSPRVHPIIFVHRVDGVPSGLYALPRRSEAGETLRQTLRSEFTWKKPDNCPDHIPLFQLMAADCSKMAKTISCNQAIAADGCFSLGMLAEFHEAVQRAPWRYRQLHWEAGLLGHVLYVEAEASGLRGTGIGCFFDDAFHELLGLQDTRFQSLYHFTVGRPLVDERIATLPAYFGRTVSLEEKQP
jgi:SagB-type dehydrogenase family enzyme